jgi:hypothetical protein
MKADRAPRTTSTIVAALERAWVALHRAHRDVPWVVLVVASGGEPRGDRLKLGHYAHGRWSVDGAPVKDGRAGEVLISGEGLQRGAADVFGTLVHEAAHGVAAARGVQDTSRGGRYHNKRFAAIAGELGLDVELDGTHGWCRTKLSESALRRWHAVVAELDAALRAHRAIETGAQKQKSARGRLLLAMCNCEQLGQTPRRIRIARAVFELGGIECCLCGGSFELQDDESEEPDDDG